MFHPVRDPVSLPVTEASQVGDARRTATTLAGRLGFGDTRRGEVAIVVTEVATNLIRHARSGEIVLRSLSSGGAAGIEILALDRGPGIANLTDALRDGYSSGGTPGTGLGAVRRLSGTFDLFSTPAGTALLSRIWAEPIPAPPYLSTPPGLDVGAVCLPRPGEEACGDAWHMEHDGRGRSVALVVDGLGHGLLAADAARKAVTLFRENARLDGPQLVGVLHAGLRATRGAAVAVADLRRDRREVRFTGVGNISGSIVSGGGSRSMVSHNGTAGAEARRLQEFVYPLPPDSLLILHSDGLASQWQLDKYAGLRLRHPGLVAGVLYRDHRRERDDVTVLVVADVNASGTPS